MIDRPSCVRWPQPWRDPDALSLLRGTSVRYLLFEDAASDAVARQARAQGLEVIQAAPQGVTVVKGLWPGVRLSRSSNVDAVSAGPTGEAWVNTNGWKVRLTAVQHPDSAIWVDARPPEDSAVSPEAYLVAIADAAMYGARWMLSLDARFAAAISSRKAGALETWRQMMRALDFFSAHDAWQSAYKPEAVVGVVSDFAGKDASFSQEALNLLARTNTQFRILLTDQVKAADLAGLKALLCLDSSVPAGDVLKTILGFVEQGGMLVAGPSWAVLPGAPAESCDNPRYSVRVLGKGRLAIAHAALHDPYAFANDSVVLVSHRNDLLRFWNAGALASLLSTEPDGRRAVLQMLFFAKELNGRVTPGQGPDCASVRVSGQYRTAMLFGPDRDTAQPVQMAVSPSAVELHLPSIAQFAAVELE